MARLLENRLIHTNIVSTLRLSCTTHTYRKREDNLLVSQDPNNEFNIQSPLNLATLIFFVLLFLLLFGCYFYCYICCGFFLFLLLLLLLLLLSVAVQLARLHLSIYLPSSCFRCFLLLFFVVVDVDVMKGIDKSYYHSKYIIGAGLANARKVFF